MKKPKLPLLTFMTRVSLSVLNIGVQFEIFAVFGVSGLKVEFFLARIRKFSNVGVCAIYTTQARGVGTIFFPRWGH